MIQISPKVQEMLFHRTARRVARQRVVWEETARALNRANLFEGGITPDQVGAVIAALAATGVEGAEVLADAQRAIVRVHNEEARRRAKR